jgi:hypothetical protein
MVRHGTWCTEQGCGWLGKVPSVRIGIVDGLEWCSEYRMSCG